jgi:hypothetical protein
VRLLILMLSAGLACTQTSCNGNERTYTITMKDGRVVEACGFREGWEYPDCMIIQDDYGQVKTRMCGVEKYEYGLPTPAPTPLPAEAPKQ